LRQTLFSSRAEYAYQQDKHCQQEQAYNRRLRHNLVAVVQGPIALPVGQVQLVEGLMHAFLSCGYPDYARFL
jgi:hypothetical protein